MRTRTVLSVVAALVIGLLGAAAPIHARTGPLGRPLIVSFDPDDYAAENQNWAAVHDTRGMLYVANTGGVLEFDGRDWRVIQVGARLAARSVAADARGRVFVGADGDFGALRPDPAGELRYVSLAAEAHLDASSVGDVFTAVAAPQGIVFQSPLGLFIVGESGLTVIRPRTQFALGFLVRNRFFVREHGRGLLELVGTRLEFVAGSERFADDRVFTMLPVGPSGILLGARDGGFQVFDPDAAPASRFVRAAGFASLERELRGKKASPGDVLPDGRLAIGTVQSGLYICFPDGRIQHHLTKADGLLDDVVYDVYTDRRGNLVLCLGVGMALVESSSPFSFVTHAAGIRGTGNAAWHLERPGLSRTFLGTYQGLYVRDTGRAAFRHVAGSQESWGFLDARGRLLFAHNDGVAEVESGTLFPVLTNQSALSLCPVRRRPDLALVGTGVGLFRLRFDGAHWRSVGPVTGFTQPVNGLSEDADGSFWLHTQTGYGVVRLTLSDGAESVQSVRRYTARDGLPSDAGNSVAPGRDGALFGTSRGIYRYNVRDDRFEPDRRFSDTHGDERQVRLLHEDRSGNVFVLAGDLARFYRPQPDGTFRGSYPFLTRLRNFRVGDFVGALDDSSLLLGYRDGFIHVDLAWTPATDVEIAPLVRRVVTPAGVAFAGSSAAEGPPPTTLPFKFNGARFWFAAPFLEGAAQTEFSYRFDGFDHEWSPWQRQNTSAYTNLREGRYDFRVRARNAYGDVSREATYRVAVEPPWFRTGFAYFVFAVLSLLVLYGAVQLNSRHLLREKTRLETLVTEKTRELREASLSDELTGLRNRRFVTEVVLAEFHAFASFKQSLLTLEDRRQPERAATVFACFLCDIDHFKRVNDEHGHEAGDLVLRQVARLLKASAREDDYAIRWGGEEFLVILKHTNRAYVPVFAEKVRKAVADAHFRRPDGAADPLRLTVSIGYSMFPFYDEAPRLLTFEQMVQLADLAMYYAKNHGRNRTAGSLPGAVRMREDDIDRSVADLDAALAAGHLVIASPATGPAPTDGRVPRLLASVHAPS